MSEWMNVETENEVIEWAWRGMVTNWKSLVVCKMLQIAGQNEIIKETGQANEWDVSERIWKSYMSCDCF